MYADKIIIVLGFLAALLVMQIIIKKLRVRNGTELTRSSNLTIEQQLHLSRHERIDLVSMGQNSFLIVTSKGSQPTVVELHSASEGMQDAI